MITGRYVKKGYYLLIEKRFLDSHAEEIKKASGFICIGDTRKMPIPGKGVRDATAVYFASPFERDMFGHSHADDCYVGQRDGHETSEDNLSAEMPVWADWYSNDQWRDWNKKPRNKKLDVVRLDYADWKKIDQAYSGAERRYGGTLSNLVLKELCLERFALLETEGKDALYYEFDYQGDGKMTAMIERAEAGHWIRIATIDISGMDCSDEKDFREDVRFASPYAKDEYFREMAYNSAWHFVILNWFIKNLPSHYTKKSAKVSANQSKKSKKRGKQKPLEVVWRDEYDIDLKGMTKTALRKEIHCLCWGVRGHVRHYKDGREVFVKPYRKGKERNSPNAYVPKTYRKEDEEDG